jgi:HlyD family secretion protein
MSVANNLRLHVLTASALAALLASLSANVSAGEPVRATGTIEPEEIVDVGAQVSGTITSLGADLDSPGKTIDYGSRVEAGTVLARIDDALYQAQVEETQAGVKGAEAQWAVAEVGAIGSGIRDVVKADLAKAQAVLKQAKIKLAYTVIMSPIKGVVIDRRVNVGQNVGPTPVPGSSLFLIASDFRKLQVWVSVPEKHISRIKVGMPATFTVDAIPKAVFQGRVSQIRLNAQMTQNVVTYTVVVTTDNSDGKLLPYLTANVEFHTGP